MSNINELNEGIMKLACEVHGLEVGDLKAIPTYEMVKKFIEENYEPKD